MTNEKMATELRKAGWRVQPPLTVANCEHPRRQGMSDIPTERSWIRTCLDLGFQPRDVKGLRQIYRKTYPPQIGGTDLDAGPPYGVRYLGHTIPKRRFPTPEAAEDWAIYNYKGSFDGWGVISLAPVPAHTEYDRGDAA